jgi:hypothetical protein
MNPPRHSHPPMAHSMRKIQDPLLWKAVYSYTPFSPDAQEYQAIRGRGDCHPDDLLVLPGICVKAGFTPKGSFTEFGRLAKFGGDPLEVNLPEKTLIEDDVVVLSNEDHETVWVGTRGQYFRMWCVD